MERFKKFMLNNAKRYRFVVPVLIITGLALMTTAHAEERQPYRF
jgi:hypothetical protein